MVKNIVIISVALVVFVLINLLAVAYIAYRKTFYNNPKKHPVDPYRVLKKEHLPFKKE